MCCLACSSDKTADLQGARPTRLTAQATQILSFENPSDWQGIHATHPEHTHGAVSGEVNVNGWTVVTSIPMSTLGEVSDTAFIDILLESPTPYWGEVRLIVKIPSLGEYYRELGSRSLIGLDAGVFDTLSFSIPTDLKNKFAASYDDLTFSVVINAPAGKYLLDNLSVGLSDDSDPGDGSETSGEWVLSMQLPSGIHPDMVGLAAGESLKINDRASVVNEAGFAGIACSGAEGVDLGVESNVGTVVSIGNVWMRERSTVHGSVVTWGDLEHQSTWTITGQLHTNTSLRPTEDIRLSIPILTDSGGDVIVPPDASEIREPGAYDRLTVNARADITLSTGIYSFTSMAIEPDARVIVNDLEGPVIVVVKESFTFRGAIEVGGYDVPRLLILYAGTSMLAIERPFVGNIFAPDAKINLASVAAEHQGSFYGREIEVHQDAVVRHRLFSDWGLVCRNFQIRNPSSNDFCTSLLVRDASSENRTLQVRIPKGISSGSVVLGADSHLTIGNNVQIHGGGANLGTLTAVDGLTTIGGGSRVPSVASVNNILLAAGAEIEGDALTEGDVLADPGAMVSGAIVNDASLTPPRIISWNIAIPEFEMTEGDFVVQPGRDRVLFKGDYGDVTVQSGARLFLEAGEYSFRSLILQAGSELIQQSSHGRTRIAVAGELVLQGSVTALGQDKSYEFGMRKADLIVGYLGEGIIRPGSGFRGVLVAPYATVEIGSSSDTAYAISVFASSIVVADNVQIAAYRTDLNEFEDTDPTDTVVIRNVATDPVILKARDDYSGSGGNCMNLSLSGVKDITIPRRLPVIEGNAGNHAATLLFTEGDGTITECRYRGGADSSHPVSPLQRARGKEYLLQDCDNNRDQNDRITVTHVRLCITGDAQSTFGTGTAVDITLDDSCEGYMPPIISEAEAIEMRQNFSWDAAYDAPRLLDDNVRGQPAMYYMNIFVESEAQLDILDALLIHWSPMPLFQDEFKRVEGKCGTVDPGTVVTEEFSGNWVYAIVPGSIYNEIVKATRSSDVEPENRILLGAMIVRDYVPDDEDAAAALFLSDGTLSYETLVYSGLYYLGLAELPSDEVLDSLMEERGSVRRALRSAFQFVANVVRRVVRVVFQVIGALDRFLHGSARLTVDFNLTKVDPTFKIKTSENPIPPTSEEKLQIGWGPNGGAELAPHDLRAQFYQFVSRPLTLGAPLLTGFRGTTNSWGRVSMDIGKNGYTGWICIDLQNDSARLTNGVITQRWCDFDNSRLAHISSDKTVAINTRNEDLLIISETTNAHNYARHVIGYRPPRATVMRGPNAMVLTGFDRTHMYAPTFSLTNAITDWGQGVVLATSSLVGIHGLGSLAAAYIEILMTADIIVPEDATKIDNGFRSHGIITHEYGHYVTFYMMHEYGMNPFIIDKVLAAYVTEQLSDVGPDDETNIVTEALADYFASQVVSGTNYFDFSNSRRSEVNGNLFKMAFCFNPPCADENDRTKNADARTKMMQLVQFLHDAVDGSTDDKQTYRATDADAWEMAPAGHLRYTATSWGDIQDEDAFIGGAGFRTVMERLAREASFGSFLNIDHLKTAVANTMKWGAEREGAFSLPTAYSDGGNTWCDACELFVLHDPDGDSKIDSENTIRPRPKRDRWEECKDSNSIIDKISSPPDPSLRLDAQCRVCPPRSISVQHVGYEVTCEPCPGINEVARDNACVECPWNAKPRGDACLPCPDGAYFDLVTGDCAWCGFGTGYDHATKQCEPCMADAVLDLADVDVSICPTVDFLESVLSAPTDNCPHQLWVHVKSLSRLRNGIQDNAIMARTFHEQPIEDPFSCSRANVKTGQFLRNDATITVIDNQSRYGDYHTHGCVTSAWTSLDALNVFYGLNDVWFMSDCSLMGTSVDCLMELWLTAHCEFIPID